ITAANAAERLSTPHGGLLARHPLVFYFLVAFAFSWLMFLPGVLTYFGILNLSDTVVGLLGIGGLLGPVLSGFIITAITKGGAGIRRWLRRIVRWRVGLQWYLFALIGLPLVMVLATIIVWPGALESFQTLAPLSVLPYLSAFVFMVLIGGPLFEEPGMERFRPAPLAAAARPCGRGPHPGEPLGPLAPAGVLDSVSGSYRHTAEGYRPRLLCVCPRSRGSQSRHYVGLQQYEGQ